MYKVNRVPLDILTTITSCFPACLRFVVLPFLLQLLSRLRLVYFIQGETYELNHIIIHFDS